MKKQILLLGFFIISGTSFGQYIQINITGNKLADYIKLENRYKSKSFRNSSDFISGQGIGQPMIFRRPQYKLPDLLVYYFYRTKDSTIDYILYEWDITNFAPQKSAGKVTKIKDWIAKYKAIFGKVSAKYGTGHKTGSLDESTSTQFIDIERRDTWDLINESIEMYITLSNESQKSGPVTISPTYRIRLYIRNKKLHI